RDVVAGALPPLASTASSLESVLKDTRPYIKGTIEQTRQLATRMDERKADINVVVENLAENYLRLNALGAYGSFFNIYYCSIRIKVNGPVGTDWLIPFGGPPDPSKGRCSFKNE
ncbi:MAG: MCE family protein, partial [[Mycobacterium] stephanolepidis]